ncbi:hypothetical protein BJ742DRAFT_882801 [Cladochytrium replicatum]|nr:hypothetical protein BJ742DRAFT_882801 [Cladochytrium replicatum]
MFKGGSTSSSSPSSATMSSSSSTATNSSTSKKSYAAPHSNLYYSASTPQSSSNHSWSCPALRRSPHHFFLSFAEIIDADAACARSLALTILPSIDPTKIHVWYAPACDPVSASSSHVQDALADSRVALVYISDPLVKFLNLASSGKMHPAHAFFAERLMNEWETALKMRNRVLIVPLFAAAYDASGGVKPFRSRAQWNALPEGKAKALLRELFAMDGPEFVPDQISGLRPYFEERLREWKARQNGQLPPMGVPVPASTPPPQQSKNGQQGPGQQHNYPQPPQEQEPVPQNYQQQQRPPQNYQQQQQQGPQQNYQQQQQQQQVPPQNYQHQGPPQNFQQQQGPPQGYVQQQQPGPPQGYPQQPYPQQQQGPQFSNGPESLQQLQRQQSPPAQQQPKQFQSPPPQGNPYQQQQEQQPPMQQVQAKPPPQQFQSPQQPSSQNSTAYPSPSSSVTTSPSPSRRGSSSAADGSSMFSSSPSGNSIAARLGRLGSLRRKKDEEAFMRAAVQNQGNAPPVPQIPQQHLQQLHQAKNRGGMLIDPANLEKMGKQMQQQQQQLRRFTWVTLAEAVANGEMLVVGAGKYVYDVASWVNLHPGGSSILYSVLGTDITNDFFNESVGFDSSHFVPSNIPIPPIQQHPNHPRPRFTPPPSASASSQHHFDSDGHTTDSGTSEGVLRNLEQQLRAPAITVEDWEVIQRSRRIHQHSKRAVAKLVEFMVGEVQSLQPVPAQAALENGEVRVFDALEYRRYAITKKTLLSPPDATYAVYLLRFCLLFPHSDIRIGEPEESFKPGQCVEVQVQLPQSGNANGSGGGGGPKWKSKYYSPLWGTTTCFEIAVKVVGESGVSAVLGGWKIGVKQVKVRGPFGTPIEPRTLHKHSRHTDVSRALGSTKQQLILGGRSGNDYIRRMIYICSGSGVIPFLQYVADTFLCVGRVLQAYASYTPPASSTKELEIRQGDGVFVKHHYGDGWGLALNTRTGLEGDFPASILVPACGLKPPGGGPSPRIHLIHCVRSHTDIIGLQSALLPASSAYPDLFTLDHLCSGPDDPVPASEYKGRIRKQRLDADAIEELIAKAFEEMEEEGGAGSTAVVVCGGSSFEQRVYETLVEEMGVPHDAITMLPPNTFWSLEA